MSQDSDLNLPPLNNADLSFDHEGSVARSGPVPVKTAEAFGWRGDSIEAEAFAYLAARAAKGLPISFPGTTGVPAPMTGGRIVEP